MKNDEDDTIAGGTIQHVAYHPTEWSAGSSSSASEYILS